MTYNLLLYSNMKIMYVFPEEVIVRYLSSWKEQEWSCIKSMERIKEKERLRVKVTENNSYKKLHLQNKIIYRYKNIHSFYQAYM